MNASPSQAALSRSSCGKPSLMPRRRFNGVLQSLSNSKPSSWDSVMLMCFQKLVTAGTRSAATGTCHKTEYSPRLSVWRSTTWKTWPGWARSIQLTAEAGPAQRSLTRWGTASVPPVKATANSAKSCEKYRVQTMNHTMPCASIRTHWLSVSGADLKTWSIGLQPAANDTRTKYANIANVSQELTCKDWLRSKLTSNNVTPNFSWTRGEATMTTNRNGQHATKTYWAPNLANSVMIAQTETRNSCNTSEVPWSTETERGEGGSVYCVLRLPRDSHAKASRGPAAPTRAAAPPGGSVYCAC